MYKKLIENIKKNGIEQIEKIVSQNEVGENFYLDFKKVSTDTNYKSLSENDKKNLSKAISGFSNTSGGILIWGVKEEDKKFLTDYISDPEKFSSLINENIYSLSDPIQLNTDSFSISNTKGIGVVVTIIHESRGNPIQANYGTYKNRYFVRIGSSHQPANSDLVKMLFAKKHNEKLNTIWSVHEDILNTKINNIKDKIKIVPVFFSKGDDLVKELWIQYNGHGIWVKDNGYLDIFESVSGGIIGNKILKLKNNETITPLTEISPMYIELDISNIDDSGIRINIMAGALNMQTKKIDIKINKLDMENFYEEKSENATVNDFLHKFFT